VSDDAYGSNYCTWLVCGTEEWDTLLLHYCTSQIVKMKKKPVTEIVSFNPTRRFNIERLPHTSINYLSFDQ